MRILWIGLAVAGGAAAIFGLHLVDSIGAVTVNGVNFGVPGRSYNISNEDEAWIARLGVNYRF